MAETSYIKMFKELGMDTRTQEEQLAEKEKARVAGGLAAGEIDKEFYPGQRDLRRGGAAIGTAIGSQWGKAKLSPEQERYHEAGKRANTIVGQRMMSGDHYLDENGKVDKGAIARDRFRERAVQLAQMGDPRGDDLLIQFDQAEMKRRKDIIEYENAVLEGEVKRDTLETNEYNKGRRIANAMASVWENGNTDENSAIELYIDGNGNARNPQTMDVVYPAGEWSRTRPISPKDLIDGIPLKDKLPSDKDRGQFLRRQRDVMSSMRLGIDMSKALASAINEDGTINIMGAAGKTTEGLSRLADNALSVARGIGDLIITDEAGRDKSVIETSNVRSWAANYAKNNPHLFEGIPWPKGMDRTDPRAVTRYQAMIVQYAYAKARMNEENGRISDVDFDNAIQQIAANATDPEGFRRVMVGDIDRAVLEWTGWYRQYDPSVRPHMVSQESLDEFNQLYKDWDAIYSQPFGTPSAATIDSPDVRSPVVLPGDPVTSTPDSMGVMDFLQQSAENPNFLNQFITPENQKTYEEDESGTGIN